MILIWTAEEITLHVQTVYREMAMSLRLFWDTVYLENLPGGCSYTSPFDLELVKGGHVDAFLDFGLGNYVCDDERRLVGDERSMVGPVVYTCPDEFTDGWVADVGASVDIPATCELPHDLTALQRVIWDDRGIDALTHRGVAPHDSRYELTKGEVYGYTWAKDGLHTLRKIRRPAALASVMVVDGSWGVLRDPTGLTSDTPTGTWGLPRRIPSHQPIGPSLFGLPRRTYLETKNVRAEFYRLGRSLRAATDTSELPARYAHYLRDGVQAKLLARPGPGQDLKLAAHFEMRWARDLARMAARVDRVTRQRMAVLGGDGAMLVARPPRPARPWQYGAEVR